MEVFRIVKSDKRTTDLSGIGAFRAGGRWNEKGTYVLYTSENSSLAFLENLVHFDLNEMPEDLFMMQIEILDEALIFLLPDSDYPKDWLITDNLDSRKFGSELFGKHRFLGIKFRSAVNRSEYNILLDPLYPGYHDLIKIRSVVKFPVDPRLF